MIQHIRVPLCRSLSRYGAAAAATYAVGTFLCAVPARAQENVTARTAPTGSPSAEEILARKVSISLTGISLANAIDSISRIAKVVVQYQVPLLEAYQIPVSMHVTATPLGILLERVLAGTALRVVANGQGSLSIIPAWDGGTDSVPVTGAISGRVVDSATGRGLVGATVKVVGSKVSAVTQDSGRFVLPTVPVGDHALTAKLFGYHPSERTVTVTDGQRIAIKIALVAAPNVLSGVVTTATGEQRDRRTMGNDITVIKADSVMRVAPIRSVTDLLEGRVPGLTVQHTSGIAGAPARLRLRGVGGGLVPGAENTNDPIVIVDGIRVDARQSTARAQNAAASGYTAPSAIDQIDPNSIETIEVFKGPSASALYGADGANGVIVITTKRGRAGAPVYSATLDAGLNYMPGQYAGPGFYGFGHNALTGAGQGYNSAPCGTFELGSRALAADVAFQCVVDSLVQFQALNVPRLSPFGTGTLQDGSVTLSGGTTGFLYAFTGSASNERGYVQMPSLYQDRYAELYGAATPSWMRRPNTLRTWRGTGSFTSTAVAGLTVQYTTSLSNSDQRQSSAENQIATLSSTYIDTISVLGTLPQIRSYVTKITSRSLTADNALQLLWSRWTRLPLQANVGLSTVDRQDATTEPYGIFTAFGPAGAGTTRFSGSYAAGRPTSRTRTANLIGTLLPRGRLTAIVGANFTQTTTQDFFGSVDSLSKGVTTPSQFSNSSQITSSLASGGWFIEPRLNVASRFFLSPGFRIDNTGADGSPGSLIKRLFNPKFDLSWVAVDHQDGAPLWGLVTLLRPRLAFGVGGIQPDPTWRSRTFTTPTLATQQVQFFYPGIRFNTIGNPLLRPERTRELEGGGDVQFWGNRLTLMGTSYYKMRYDAITLLPVAPSLGAADLRQYRNFGQVRNTGAELTTTVNPIQRASVVWTVTATVSTNREKVLALNDSASAIVMSPQSRIVQGYPLDGVWDRPIVGYVSPAPGASFGFGNVLIGDSVVYLGRSQPGSQWPVSSSLALFRGLIGVNVGFVYQHGYTQTNTGSTQLLTNLWLDSSTTLGQKTAVLAAYCASPDNGCASIGTIAGVVQTVNTLRFTTLSLNYNVPQGMRRRLRLPRTGVALQGNNLALWTNYRGKDPDVNGTPVGEAITDNGQVPAPRTWSIKITMGN